MIEPQGGYLSGRSTPETLLWMRILERCEDHDLCACPSPLTPSHVGARGTEVVVRGSGIRAVK